MTDVSQVVRRFAAQELAIRRLYGTDPDFKDVCEAYAVAVRALEVWAGDEGRTEEYRCLVGELEAEILEYLEHPR